MTQPERPKTAREFLSVWYPLAETNNTRGLEQWESHFPELAETAPDMTLEILRELAESDTPGATEAAAIYARYLFPIRPTETTDLLVSLFQAGDDDIRENVLSTTDVITSDPHLNPTHTAALRTAVGANQA
jgi:hypothetical protein